jgi:hypothetical protein
VGPPPNRRPTLQVQGPRQEHHQAGEVREEEQDDDLGDQERPERLEQLLVVQAAADPSHQEIRKPDILVGTNKAQTLSSTMTCRAN